MSEPFEKPLDNPESGYTAVATMYLAMVPEEAARGNCVANPFMQRYVDALDNGAAILDAPCGVGWNAVSIVNQSRRLKKSFRVAVSDASPEMLFQAQLNVETFFEGTVTLDSKQAKLDQLVDIDDWENRFDLILVPNVISELFGNMPAENYEDHVQKSLLGIRHILKENGTMLIDSRDWAETHLRAMPVTRRKNEHDGIMYRARYDWRFGKNVDDVHIADTKFWDYKTGEEKATRNRIRFAGRSHEQLTAMFEKAGLEIVNYSPQSRGLNDEPFITYALQPR